jgi:uncharacterized protein YbaP (TraB family)
MNRKFSPLSRGRFLMKVKARHFCGAQPLQRYWPGG